MKKEFTKSLFIFRRDLRLDDNTGLLAALAQSEQIIPCFIFDPQQVGKQNSYRSMNAIQFMIESLEDLANQLKNKNGKLYIFYGSSEKIIKKLIKDENIKAVFCNRDYTPFSIKRDMAIKKICLQNECAFEQFNDLLLTQPEEITTQSGTPYQKFTPFFKTARKKSIAQPLKCKATNFYSKTINGCETKSIYKKILSKTNNNILVHGGRAHGLKILKNIKKFKDYAKTRDYPSIGTTHLSAHNKFGTVSIREVYHAIVQQLGKQHLLIQQLYWRDFFTHVAFNAPFVFGHAYQERYNKLKWPGTKKQFNAWCDGKTGFPLVDAGMRQLNKTGFMHNRVRMIVASLLTKDLHINWLDGEKYFAQQLVDYDPCVNNGNWQWVAGTGCDAQPYFRIFNPWLQQKKFDPQCKYIKQWIPELKDVAAQVIHNWFKSAEKIKIYPKPLVNHKIESQRAKALYKKAR
jgi:deoxyribodipyrimidine photo-lyase